MGARAQPGAVHRRGRHAVCAAVARSHRLPRPSSLRVSSSAMRSVGRSCGTRRAATKVHPSVGASRHPKRLRVAHGGHGARERAARPRCFIDGEERRHTGRHTGRTGAALERRRIWSVAPRTRPYGQVQYVHVAVQGVGGAPTGRGEACGAPELATSPATSPATSLADHKPRANQPRAARAPLRSSPRYRTRASERGPTHPRRRPHPPAAAAPACKDDTTEAQSSRCAALCCTLCLRRGLRPLLLHSPPAATL